MPLLRRHLRLGQSIPTVIAGLVITVLVAIGATAVSVDAIRSSQEEAEKLSRASEQRGFAIRHIERVEALSAELETALLGWMLEPDETRNALQVERLSRSFDAQATRLSEILPHDERHHWIAIRTALREVRSVLSRLRVTGRLEAAPGVPPDVHGELDAPLARVRKALDTAGEDLRSDRVLAVERLEANLTRASRASVTGGVLFVVVVGAIWLLILRVLMHKQAELDASMSKIVRANAELDAFAGRTAHELRNVLAPASMAVQLLDHGAGEGGDDRRVLERLGRSFQRASAVIEALLAFSRAGKATLGPTSIAAVVAEVVDATRPRAEAEGIELSSDVDDLQLACDAGLVHTVVVNLVGNAVKFSAGQKDATVAVTVTRDDDRAQICVRDNGPGIPDEELPHVFEPFFRAAGSTAEGTGIGLATVSKIARVHGGRAEVHSRPGRGTTVRVWLPLATDSRQTSSQETLGRASIRPAG